MAIDPHLVLYSGAGDKWNMQDAWASRCGCTSLYVPAMPKSQWTDGNGRNGMVDVMKTYGIRVWFGGIRGSWGSIAIADFIDYWENKSGAGNLVEGYFVRDEWPAAEQSEVGADIALLHTLTAKPIWANMNPAYDAAAMKALCNFGTSLQNYPNILSLDCYPREAADTSYSSTYKKTIADTAQLVRWMIDGYKATPVTQSPKTGQVLGVISQAFQQTCLNRADKDTLNTGYCVVDQALMDAQMRLTFAQGEYAYLNDMVDSIQILQAGSWYTWYDGGQPSGTRTNISGGQSNTVRDNLRTYLTIANGYKSGYTITGGVIYPAGGIPAVQKTATPVISPTTGTYATAQSATVSCSTDGATIYYTTNGTDPTTNSAVFSSSIPVAATTTVKALAAKSGMTSSDVATATITIGAGASPYLDPSPITLPLGWEQAVHLRGTTEKISSVTTSNTAIADIGAIYPTTPGTYFTLNSGNTGGSATITVTLTNNAVITLAVTVVSQTVATPAISPGTGIYGAPVTATITCATSGATIRYTIDGTEPTASSAVYSAGLAISVSTTVKARAFKAGLSDSTTGVAVITITIPQPQQVATPLFTPGTGIYGAPVTATITCATSGATIRYTIDGTDPTASSAIYSTPLAISVTTTIKAYATLAGNADSVVSSAAYTFPPPPPGNLSQIRYYPMTGFESRSNGGVFSVSNDLASWTDVYTIPATPPAGWNTVSVTTAQTWRYFRFISSPAQYAAMAEIEYYNNAVKLAGGVSSSPFSTGYPPSAAFDGATEAAWKSAEKGGWVILDPNASINSIPRLAPASITIAPGEEARIVVANTGGTSIVSINNAPSFVEIGYVASDWFNVNMLDAGAGTLSVLLSNGSSLTMAMTGKIITRKALWRSVPKF